ncbi:NAD(P)H-dependent glycerol-3-phosphate dehydrogenase [Legionella brunensis]|uniref:Glycerol-3-phosphate dehydrogenase [NAD(P)+] n=1 Tax=Legionella brunensis TaxID=29422 RepID=A0A0W0S0Y5_9GAMM|nr:NAD(P)H-dependent glycerol-3-phosphate dehydrogenase [Legionella brunensis]KTC77003.1 glycerol-3-phosphate dehydrogenase (NAD+) [Legionella brunensis]
MKTKKIAILGAGSWGTAVAVHLANCGNQVMLWGHSPQHVKEMIAQRCNQRYLGDVIFPQSLIPVVELNQCLEQATEIIIAVPSHAFAKLLYQIHKPECGLAWLTKGIDPIRNKLLSELVAERWGQSFPIAIISGPSFAREVAHFLPTALTLASNNPDYQKSIQSLLHCNNIRAYLSNDVIGVQLCGAVKNVLAIACGISDGLGYGANAKAALITRGLAEMRRLGIQMGAREDTFMGLAGVGDLVLTCTDDQSRNRRFGLCLGRGISSLEAEKQIGQVVEGKHNAAQVCALAEQFQVEVPICSQVNDVLKDKITPQQATINLMSRSPREE